MPEKMDEMVNRIKAKKWFGKDNFLILVLVGILLFVVAIPTGKKTQEEENGAGILQNIKSTETTLEKDEEDGLNQNFLSYSEKYSQNVERKLEELLSEVEGVGEVKVMVMLASTEEVMVEKDESTDETRTMETDSQGGNREVRQFQKKEETLTYKQGTNEMPFVAKTLSPEIEGVLVVAKGAGNGTMDKKITEMVQAVTGLEAHRIIVAKMRDSH